MSLPFADETITIFNKVEDLDPVTNKTFTIWKRHVLKNCSWRRSLQTMQVGNIQISSDDVIVQVPASVLYVPYHIYENMTDDEQSLYFTANAGDILINGEVEDEITKEFTVTKLKEKYKGRSLTVKAFQNNALKGYPLPHYQYIGG